MSEQQQNSPAEIDLTYFFRPLVNGLKKIGQGLLYWLYKIKTNKLFFGIIVFLGTAAGFSLRYIIPPAYQTQGIFVSSVLPAKYCSFLIQNLNRLKGTENALLLAQQLKISPEATADIQSIRLQPMRDTFSLDKRDTTLSLFRITLVLKNMQQLDTIQWGLVNYLENNEYAMKRKEARRKALEALKITLNQKLQSLDSLKKIVNSSIIPRSEGKGIILGEPVDPVSVYQAEVAYYKEQLNIDQALATIDNIEVIQPFLKINQHNFPGYNRMLAWFFLVSLAAAAVLILLFGKKTKY